MRVLVLIVCVLFIVIPIVAAQDDTRLTINTENAAKLRLLQTYDHTPVEQVAYSPDAAALAVTTPDTLLVLNTADGSLRWEREAQQPQQVSWSYDNTMLAVMHDSGKLSVLDATSGRPIIAISAASPTLAAFSPVDNLLAYNDGSRLFVASMQFGAGTRDWQMPASIRDIQWAPNGQQLAVVAQRHVLVWDVNAEQETYRLNLDTASRVERVNWRPEPMALATIDTQTATIRLYEAASGRVVASFRGHSDTVRSIGWSPDGTLLASVGDDGRLLLWDADAQQVLSEQSLLAPRQVLWSPDSTQIATVASGQVALWGVLHEPESVAADTPRLTP